MIERIYPEPTAGPDPDPEPTPDGAVVREITFVDEPGVLQSVDERGLLKLASDAGVVIELVPHVGDLLPPGAPLFRIHGEAEAISDEELRHSVAVGDERTMGQDPAFIFRLLADISSKALSPGVNDPTTSVQALDQIELLLRQLAGKQLDAGVLRDESGVARCRFPTASWADFLSVALDETRFFGAGSVQVTRRLRALLEDLRAAAPEYRRPAVEAQLALLDQSVGRSYEEAATLAIARGRDRQGIGSPR